MWVRINITREEVKICDFVQVRLVSMANILGLIRLRIKKGTNLIPHDSRTSDPYVLVTMEEQVS